MQQHFITAAVRPTEKAIFALTAAKNLINQAAKSLPINMAFRTREKRRFVIKSFELDCGG